MLPCLSKETINLTFCLVEDTFTANTRYREVHKICDFSVPFRTPKPFLKFGKPRHYWFFDLNCKLYAKIISHLRLNAVTVNAKNKILLRKGNFPAFSSEFLPR